MNLGVLFWPIDILMLKNYHTKETIVFRSVEKMLFCVRELCSGIDFSVVLATIFPTTPARKHTHTCTYTIIFHARIYESGFSYIQSTKTQVNTNTHTG